ncbi:hypothetical protein MNBD_CHLOROFLEXI01-4657 [hydrothermal vent metagenome]|uniref:Uncharacterized protein n=1 Tax=hydrothermal vent metagenome TaxID=652676 RepID=A0A3B0UNY8_9ZZZZ
MVVATFVPDTVYLVQPIEKVYRLVLTNHLR